MGKKTRKPYRSFLNPGTSELGAVSVEVSGEGSTYLDATLQLSDCNRKVELYFSASSLTSAKDRKKKVEAIRKALDILDSVIDEYIKTHTPATS